MVSLCLQKTLWRKTREIIPASVVSKRHWKLQDPPYLSHLLFSAKYYNAFNSSSRLVLSAIRIPIQWCPPTFQRSHKAFRFCRRLYKIPRRVLFGLFYFSSLVCRLATCDQLCSHSRVFNGCLSSTIATSDRDFSNHVTL